MNAHVGTPISRIDGPAKVTGKAKYAGEFEVEGLAYGFVVEATITKGRIRRMDAAAALKVRACLMC